MLDSFVVLGDEKIAGWWDWRVVCFRSTVCCWQEHHCRTTQKSCSVFSTSLTQANSPLPQLLPKSLATWRRKHKWTNSRRYVASGVTRSMVVITSFLLVILLVYLWKMNTKNNTEGEEGDFSLHTLVTYTHLSHMHTYYICTPVIYTPVTYSHLSHMQCVFLSHVHTVIYWS